MATLMQVNRDRNKQLQQESLAPMGVSQAELVRRAKEGIACGDVVSQSEMLNRKLGNGNRME